MRPGVIGRGSSKHAGTKGFLRSSRAFSWVVVLFKAAHSVLGEGTSVWGKPKVLGQRHAKRDPAWAGDGSWGRAKAKRGGLCRTVKKTQGGMGI